MPLTCIPIESLVVLFCVLQETPQTWPQFPQLWRWELDEGEEVKVRLPQEELFPERDVVLQGKGRAPSVFTIDGLMHPTEIAALSGAFRKTKSAVLSTADGAATANQWRSGKTATFPAKGKTAEALSKRLSVILRLPLQVLMNSTLQLVKYDSKEHYYPHYDSKTVRRLGQTDSTGNEMTYPYAARFLTVLIYLENSTGETMFPWAGTKESGIPAASLSGATAITHGSSTLNTWQEYCALDAEKRGGFGVKPVAGRAAVFYSHYLAKDRRLGEMDPYSLHGGCDVRDGGTTKKLLNFWVHIQPSDFEGAKAEPDVVGSVENWMRRTPEGREAKRVLLWQARRHLLKRRYMRSEDARDALADRYKGVCPDNTDCPSAEQRQMITRALFGSGSVAHTGSAREQ